MKQKKVYNLIRSNPVARFFYQGSHSHPVRRTVLVIENTKNRIVGYELRDGNVVRTPNESLKYVRSYRKDKIAKWGDYSRLRQSYKSFFRQLNESTLERQPIVALFEEGA